MLLNNQNRDCPSAFRNGKNAAIAISDDTVESAIEIGRMYLSVYKTLIPKTILSKS